MHIGCQIRHGPGISANVHDRERLDLVAEHLDLVAEVDVHGLDGGIAAENIHVSNTGEERVERYVLLEGVLAELAADAGLLVPAEGDLGVQLVRAVDLLVIR